jgi:hypothetical protein
MVDVKNPRDSLYSNLLEKYFGGSADDRREYGRMLRQELIADLGGCCFICKSADRLQFAHMDDTLILSTGRGMILRYSDVILNKRLYKLLCKRCHGIFDIIRKDNDLKPDIALNLVKEFIAEDKNITGISMMEFNVKENKFVLKNDYYLRVKKEM